MDWESCWHTTVSSNPLRSSLACSLLSLSNLETEKREIKTHEPQCSIKKFCRYHSNLQIKRNKLTKKAIVLFIFCAGNRIPALTYARHVHCQWVTSLEHHQFLNRPDLSRIFGYLNHKGKLLRPHREEEIQRVLTRAFPASFLSLGLLFSACHNQNWVSPVPVAVSDSSWNWEEKSNIFHISLKFLATPLKAQFHSKPISSAQ